MGLTFQIASYSDLPQIVLLSQKIWIPTFAPFFGSEELKVLYDGMYNIEVLNQWLSEPGNTMYIINRDDKPLGYFATAKDGLTLKLDKIYVLPECQGTGFGGRAMSFVESEASKAGCGQIALRVNRENKKAIDFYLAKGLIISSSIDVPAKHGYFYKDYIMTKILHSDRL